MGYDIAWTPKALEGMKRLDPEVKRRIIRKVADLEFAPYHFVERMAGVNAYRLRVGDYRVIIDILENPKQIGILKVGHREQIYKP